jgi:hypothetical protein
MDRPWDVLPEKRKRQNRKEETLWATQLSVYYIVH